MFVIRGKILQAVRRINKLGNSIFHTSSPAMSADIQAKVDKLIADHKVFVISKANCPYCKRVEALFNGLNLSPDQYRVWNIERDANCNQIQNYMSSLTGARSVPRVFVNGKFIGGCDDTMKLHSTGELAKLLEN